MKMVRVEVQAAKQSSLSRHKMAMLVLYYVNRSTQQSANVVVELFVLDALTSAFPILTKHFPSLQHLIICHATYVMNAS